MKLKFYFCLFIAATSISLVCSAFGQLLLKIVFFNASNKNLVFFALIVFLYTIYSNKKLKTETIGISYFLEKSLYYKRDVSNFYGLNLIINTFLSHLSGMSVGREGVAVQLGGFCGDYFSNRFKLAYEHKKFLIRCGMICGFSALFHTPLAAIFFILEILYQKGKLVPRLKEILIYFIFSYYSSILSSYLGLKKFFYHIDVVNLSFNKYLLILVCALLVIGLSILFIVCQKKIKIIKNMELRLLLLVLVIGILYFTDGRYNSLGTNFIDGFFYNNMAIHKYDFFIKIFVTIICTGIGFSGGEVTPLFSIGLLFGVLYAEMFSLPAEILASLSYILMFSSSARIFITPIFLALEVFSYKIALLIIIPSIMIKLINKKYSIY